MAKKWVQSAVHKPGRIRRALGLKEDEPVTNEKLDALSARLHREGRYDKSWAGAISLARRFISKGGIGN